MNFSYVETEFYLISQEETYTSNSSWLFFLPEKSVLSANLPKAICYDVACGCHDNIHYVQFCSFFLTDATKDDAETINVILSEGC